MQVRCKKAFGAFVPGDVVDGVPDGAAVDPEHFEAVTAPAPPAPVDPPKPAAPVPPAAALTPKEGA